MVIGDSPAGARRRVRLAIREARGARGLTQAHVAEAMEWSLSKVARIEAGEVTIAPNDLRPLLTYLGVTDGAVVDRLVQDARTSRRRAMWWDEPRIREHLTPASRLLIQYEAEATEIRSFQVNVAVPGILQLPEYAAAIIASYGMAEEVARARLDSRIKRRNVFIERTDPIQVYLLLDEAALRRRWVAPDIQVSQLNEFLRQAQLGRLGLRVLHFAADVPPPMFGPFDILSVPDVGGGAGSSILYRESQFLDELVDDPANVKRHREMFDELWAGALDEAASRRMIEETISALGGTPAVGSTNTQERRRQPRRKK